MGRASWRISKRLFERIEENNKAAVASGGPIVDTAPLPARAQFLNVIESIFSGMARAIIHNSSYQSVEEAKGAINRYFDQRNRHFREHPRRAGKRIWASSECRLSSLTGIAAKTRDSGECLRSNVRSPEGPPIRQRPLSLLKQTLDLFPLLAQP